MKAAIIIVLLCLARADKRVATWYDATDIDEKLGCYDSAGCDSAGEESGALRVKTTPSTSSMLNITTSL